MRKLSDHRYSAASSINRRQCWRFTLLLELLEALFTSICKWEIIKRGFRDSKTTVGCHSVYAPQPKRVPTSLGCSSFAVGCLHTNACLLTYCVTQKLLVLLCFPVSLNILWIVLQNNRMCMWFTGVTFHTLEKKLSKCLSAFSNVHVHNPL